MPVQVELMTLIAPEAAYLRVREAAGLDLAALDALGIDGDGELVVLYFHRSPALQRAAGLLAEAGLVMEREDEEPGELAAVDQRYGPLAWWPWLELAHVEAPAAAGGGMVLAVRRTGSAEAAVSLPRGWKRAGSPTERFGLGVLRLVDRPLRHLRREAACDVYADRWTGELVKFPRRHAPVTVRVEGAGGRRAEVRCELVEEEDEVELGLMFREVLPPGTGMLFDFGEDRPHGFWMKNTLVPLDLLFVDAGGRVVNVAEGARPLSTFHHRSRGPVRRVLEVPAGWCRATGLGVGARVWVEGEARPPTTDG